MRQNQVPGQLSVLDELVDIQRVQDYADRHTCDHCALTYWAAPSNPYWTLARQDAEHVEVEPGVCLTMADARDTLERYVTGRCVGEPSWSKRDMEIHILQLRDMRDRIWQAYDQRQAQA